MFFVELVKSNHFYRNSYFDAKKLRFIFAKTFLCMNEILEILKYTVPSIVTGLVAAYLLKQYVAVEHNKQKFELLKDKKQQGLPIRLQAYERMTLLMERINLASIVMRIAPLETNQIEYAQLLIQQINSEFEHNLVQQIYVSDECWDIVKNTKQTILNAITAQSMKEPINSGKKLQQALLEIVNDSGSPTVVAQQFIQQEVRKLF